jgi:hypothetical protein
MTNEGNPFTTFLFLSGVPAALYVMVLRRI